MNPLYFIAAGLVALALATDAKQKESEQQKTLPKPKKKRKKPVQQAGNQAVIESVKAENQPVDTESSSAAMVNSESAPTVGADDGDGD